MADPVDTRLRAARPRAAVADPDAFDAELLRRIRSAPVARRNRRRLLLPAAAAVVAVAAAVLVLVPGSATAPTAEAAVRQAMRWFDPPPGTVVHYRNVIRGQDVPPLVQEVWQSVDHPGQLRRLESWEGTTVEVADGLLHDPAANTTYVDVAPPRAERVAALRRALDEKYEGAKRAGASAEQLRRMRADFRAVLRHPDAPAGGSEPAGDTVVAGIRAELERGSAQLGAETTHAGVPALPITLEPGPRGETRPRWTLWTDAADGRPLELRIDSGPGTPVLQTTMWTTYEVLRDADATLSVRAAHPDARIVRGHQEYEAARARLFPRG